MVLLPELVFRGMGGFWRRSFSARPGCKSIPFSVSVIWGGAPIWYKRRFGSLFYVDLRLGLGSLEAMES